MKLLKGKRVIDIVKIVRNVTPTPNTKKVLNNLRNEGFRLGLISDDLDIVTENFAERHRLDYIICNKAEIKNGRFTGKIKFVRNIDDYENWKKAVVRDLKRDEQTEIITVGSENIDAPMLKEANVGIAFNGTKKAKVAADVVINEPDMDEVLKSIVETNILPK
jgi:phosphoserine phosphatase